MDIVDDRGRLFGRINIVDALVVLLVLTALLAAVALVTSPGQTGDDQQLTRYATVELSDAPVELARLVTTGNVTLNGASGRITDVHHVTAGSNRDAFVRVRLRGTEAERESGTVFTVEGQDVSVGKTVRLETERYVADGTVLVIDESGPDLPVSTTTVTITGTVPSVVADDIERGDTATVAGQRIGVVESVSASDTATSNRSRVELTLGLRTLDRPGGPYFGDQPIRRGSTLTFTTNDYRITGTVIELR